jgi:hypothetical protein
MRTSPQHWLNPRWSSGRLLDPSTPTVDRLLGDAVDLYLGEAEARKALAGVLA